MLEHVLMEVLQYQQVGETVHMNMPLFLQQQIRQVSLVLQTHLRLPQEMMEFMMYM